eukprot:m.337252 g.337252  ORF g.337252 m.337252 type:complete len:867 (+) comp18085_c0_seq1:1154-3754(+)
MPGTNEVKLEEAQPPKSPSDKPSPSNSDPADNKPVMTDTVTSSGYSSDLTSSRMSESTMMADGRPLETKLFFSDWEAKCCLNCGKRFQGRVRRYHCHLCAISVCSKCSSKRLALFPDVLVCSRCYELNERNLKVKVDLRPAPIAVREGVLYKRGHFHKAWRRREFVLDSNSNMSYFKERGSKLELQGIIPLKNVRVRLCNDPDRKWPEKKTHESCKTGFALDTPSGKIYYLYTETKAELTDWLQIIFLSSMICWRCAEPCFEGPPGTTPKCVVLRGPGQFYHPHCFVCEICLRDCGVSFSVSQKRKPKKMSSKDQEKDDNKRLTQSSPSPSSTPSPDGGRPVTFTSSGSGGLPSRGGNLFREGAYYVQNKLLCRRHAMEALDIHKDLEHLKAENDSGEGSIDDDARHSGVNMNEEAVEKFMIVPEFVNRREGESVIRQEMRRRAEQDQQATSDPNGDLHEQDMDLVDETTDPSSRKSGLGSVDDRVVCLFHGIISCMEAKHKDAIDDSLTSPNSDPAEPDTPSSPPNTRKSYHYEEETGYNSDIVISRLKNTVPDDWPSPGRAYEILDFASSKFQQVRDISKINESEYIESFQTLPGAAMSGGRSGSAVIPTADQRYIVKSMSPAERRVLLDMLDEYISHLQMHPLTLLVRFLGIFEIKVAGGSPVCYCVMADVLGASRAGDFSLEVHERYDLKGSVDGRRVLIPGSKSSNPLNFRGTLKDYDLRRIIKVGNRAKAWLDYQINLDAFFLSEMNLMDYSLLVGIHNCTPDGGCCKARREQERGDDGVVHTADLCKWGVRAPHPDIPGGESVYFFGIIDPLQEWDQSKRVEQTLKTTLLRKNKNSISAVEPNVYRERFANRLSERIEE